jgi:hypothetical protein
MSVIRTCTKLIRFKVRFECVRCPGKLVAESNAVDRVDVALSRVRAALPAFDVYSIVGTMEGGAGGGSEGWGHPPCLVVSVLISYFKCF